ncbi:radical SAM protein [Candidatus Desantisbacteria bacterium CG_4_10_14_0_8_um_filter_48_22]|uniref:Radical SAM protein n=1 Tax=Candidatus Desantisbacteria bacterium CG_4_10_14_0_8_um_filter_48_22 TaxID=1974543 RepID=A0A2M7S6L7_9BACT|nr:MAG: radical SAM protein [Candidatus Desantisbacteria bacterium CG02_land_8_20_14_3_00_49_13]PIZ15146.1 MAG: radical SAM protein [Candidatus Desantisbacteria bacterium CG_4_10_14_0_8_um_filter_48_22]
MEKRKLNCIYGPVASWRLGTSLGIDILSQKGKACNFDCIYCQLGNKKPCKNRRKEFVPVAGIIKEVRSLPRLKVDYMTFSGKGEPTLASNLGKAIRSLKKYGRVSVLTNSALLSDRKVRKELGPADFVAAKLDSYSQGSLEKVNRPARGITFPSILKGIKQFRREFKGRFGLQVMFIRQNGGNYKEIAGIAADIKPDEVQINTPLRPSGGAKPLPKKEIACIAAYFGRQPGLAKTKIITVYDRKRKKVKPLNLRDTLKRRGKLLK